jgi:hypothetical protein
VARLSELPGDWAGFRGVWGIWSNFRGFAQVFGGVGRVLEGLRFTPNIRGFAQVFGGVGRVLEGLRFTPNIRSFVRILGEVPRNCPQIRVIGRVFGNFGEFGRKSWLLGAYSGVWGIWSNFRGFAQVFGGVGVSWKEAAIHHEYSGFCAHLGGGSAKLPANSW